MKIKSTTQDKEYTKPCIPEEFYTGTLKDVKSIKDGEYGARIAFIYTIDEQEIDGEEVELAYVCYIKNPANKDNKLGQLVIAHGVELNDDEIELDALIGTKVKILVENYKEGDADCSGIGKVKSLE